MLACGRLCMLARLLFGLAPLLLALFLLLALCLLLLMALLHLLLLLLA